MPLLKIHVMAFRLFAQRSLAAFDIFCRVSSLFGAVSPRVCTARAAGDLLAHAFLLPALILAFTSSVRSAAIRFSFVSGSVFSLMWALINGPLGSRTFSRRDCKWGAENFRGLPVRAFFIRALNSGSAHLAFIFSRTSGRLAGLLSPVYCRITCFSRSVALARITGSFIGLFSIIRRRWVSMPASDMFFDNPSPPILRFVSGPVPSWARPNRAI